MRASKLMLLAAMARLSAGAYVLEDDYQPSNFFDDFRFFDGADRSGAYVTYLSQADAEKAGLASTDGNVVHLGVDHTDIASGRGRKSVRLSTKKSYKHGLIVADIAHMPGGICGTWPAFWSTGASWPEDGEFDIIEGVNGQKQNAMALHSVDGCKVKKNAQSTGKMVTTNCDVFAPEQPGNQGCLVEAPTANSYGPEFNAIKGGVYAAEWTNDAITMWFFPRSQIPADISSQSASLDPSSWPKPVAHFTGDCDFDKFFQEQIITFNTAFCGDWAKNTWSTDPVCSTKAESCEEYVKNNPEAFKEAYWSINYMKVFQDRPYEEPPKPSTKATTSTKTTKTNKPTHPPPTSTKTNEPTYPPAPSSETNQPPPDSSSAAPTDPKPTESPTHSQPGKPTCTTPPPTPRCTTFTTQTTIAIVKTISPSDKEAIIPIYPSASDVPVKYKAGPGPFRRRQERHAAGRHRG
ncbi:hypothetical protein FQN52_005621 [Onygenales sp. PD_12]|nr:hypothetical protein FQN52_005621 [Onygenales sp. PD_12]